MNYRVDLIEDAGDFILSLNLKMQAKVQRTIGLLEEFGFNLKEPHVKKIRNTEDLFELRIKAGSDICRLFFFFWKNRTFIITSGYMKKTNKTDPNEIKRAVRIMGEFRRDNE